LFCFFSDKQQETRYKGKGSTQKGPGLSQPLSVVRGVGQTDTPAIFYTNQESKEQGTRNTPYSETHNLYPTAPAPPALAPTRTTRIDYA
jgi:hypothetical protein